MAEKREDPSDRELVPESDEELLAECRVDTFRSGGKGGQHQNVTDSGVRLTHRPTGTVVVSREERSQQRNRRIALERLRVRLAESRRPQKPRRPTKPTASSKRRRLEDKRKRGSAKRLRGKPTLDDSDGST